MIGFGSISSGKLKIKTINKGDWQRRGAHPVVAVVNDEALPPA